MPIILLAISCQVGLFFIKSVGQIILNFIVKGFFLGHKFIFATRHKKQLIDEGKPPAKSTENTKNIDDKNTRSTMEQTSADPDNIDNSAEIDT